MTIYTVNRKYKDGDREMAGVLGSAAHSSSEDAADAMKRDVDYIRQLLGSGNEKAFSSDRKSAKLESKSGEIWTWNVEELIFADGKRG